MPKTDTSTRPDIRTAALQLDLANTGRESSAGTQTRTARDPDPEPAKTVENARTDPVGTWLDVDFSALLSRTFFGKSRDTAGTPDTLPPPINGNTGGLMVEAADDGPLVLYATTLYGSADDDLIHGTDFGETILGNGSTGWDALAIDDDVLYGHGGDDTIIGGFGNDILDGGDGSDELYGGFGDDTLTGGDGRDSLHGGGGNDSLYDEGMTSTLFGEDGNDTLTGGDGQQWLDGGAHDDLIDGGAGNDLIWGDTYDGGVTQPGNDMLSGGDGDDMIDGHMGNDFIEGGDGDDRLYGGPGDDVILGGNGNDLLTDDWPSASFPGGGDMLDGGAGDDILVGRAGGNVLTGGGGADIFLISLDALNGDPYQPPTDLSFNTITDYSVADGDKVQGVATAQVGTSTHVYGPGNELLFILLNHDLANDGIDLVWV